MKELLSKLPSRIKISGNKNPVRMDQFLSFLTVDVKKVTESFLGKSTGWTKHTDNGEAYSGNLQIQGGWVTIINSDGKKEGVELLDSIEYGKNLSNPYNNYVNPFFLFEILNKEGKEFFLDYYRKDIDEICDVLAKKYQAAKKAMDDTNSFWRNLELEVSTHDDH